MRGEAGAPRDHAGRYACVRRSLMRAQSRTSCSKFVVDTCPGSNGVLLTSNPNIALRDPAHTAKQYVAAHMGLRPVRDRGATCARRSLVAASRRVYMYVYT